MNKWISALLILVMLLNLSLGVIAVSIDKVDAALESVGNYIYEKVKKPVVASVGGEWTIIGLARSGLPVPDEYFENYYRRVVEYIKGCDGILHDKKYTEYSRVVIALTAIGKNPKDVAGYNLLTPLGDYEKTVWQGINGVVWALIALDSGNYDMPENKNANIQATREMYINYILQSQTNDGGWALSGDVADPDVTGMALCALSKYQDDDVVKVATEKALNCLSKMQNDNGGFSSYKTENSESCVQMLVALCELGVSIYDDRFVKNGKSVLDNLFAYYDGEKGFKHVQGDSVNLMATEQCFYALVALKRASENNNSLYSMSDTLNIDFDESGLWGKHADIKKINVTDPDKTFQDIAGHGAENAIETLASRGIINGKSNNRFLPDDTMTRAEFATIIVRALGLTKMKSLNFKDVTKNNWFYNYVSVAFNYGIIKGVSETKFSPYETITREEAAVMVSRAASLCGMNTIMDNSVVRDILAQFLDYIKTSSWSKNSLAFCYKENILDDSAMEIKPFEAVTRAEIASMIYNMLSLAKLI